MSRLAKNEFTYGRHIDFDEIIKAIEAVSVDDVVKLATGFLLPEKLSLTALGAVEPDGIPADLLT